MTIHGDGPQALQKRRFFFCLRKGEPAADHVKRGCRLSSSKQGSHMAYLIHSTPFKARWMTYPLHSEQKSAHQWPGHKGTRMSFSLCRTAMHSSPKQKGKAHSQTWARAHTHALPSVSSGSWRAHHRGWTERFCLSYVAFVKKNQKNKKNCPVSKQRAAALEPWKPLNAFDLVSIRKLSWHHRKTGRECAISLLMPSSCNA